MEEIQLDPEPKILIESLRDIGYSFNSALADIVDNSITANATRIKILAIPEDEFRIAIIDDGEGLTHDELKQAMRLGSSDPRIERDLHDLGRFGLGLKTASFSQCRRLTVVSRKNGQINAFTWDLDLVVETNTWSVIERDDIDDIPYIEELGGSGTLVLWEKLDRLTGARGSGKVNHTRVISEAQDHLALVFHRFIVGERGIKRISILVNMHELEAIDPFNTNHRATQRYDREHVCPGVTIQAFTLPHRSQYKSAAEYDRYGLRGGYLKSQGIYLYRAKRLIIYGTWFGLAKKTALTQLARVKIDIDVNQDEAWKIDVKKVSAQMPEVVRSRIKALIATIGAPSKRTYRKRATRLTSSETYPTWTPEKIGEKRVYRINRTHPVIETMRETLSDKDAKSFETVLSLIESTFPTEALFFDLSNDEDSVSCSPIEDEQFQEAALTFFATLKASGLREEAILGIMRYSEPFMSKWDDTLIALGIEEQ